MKQNFDVDFILRERNPIVPLVVLMCGVSGSGKTTFAKNLESSGFIRLSIDEEVWETNGRWGVDFPMAKIEEFRDDAETKLKAQLVDLIENKQDVVVDHSFWDRNIRNEYKSMIESLGGQCKIVYVKVQPQLIWKRLQLRNQRFDANSFPISYELFEEYWNGFDFPNDEGELVFENE